MILILIVIAVISCFLYYFFTRTFNYWRDKNVAGPKPLLFFGNLKESALRQKHVGIVYKEIYDEFPNERVIGIYRMTSPTLIIRDLDIVKQILIKDFDAFPDRGIEYSKEGLGDNLFHCDSKTWRALRNKLTPLFTSAKLKSVVHLLDKYADQLVNYLDAAILKNGEQEMHYLCNKYAIASIMAVSFSLDVDIFNENGGIIEQAGHYIFRSTYAAEIDMLFPNVLKKLNVSFYPSLVNKFSYDVVNTSINQKDSMSRNDLIDELLAMRKDYEINNTKAFGEIEDRVKPTDHVMAGQVFIFFAAGFGNNGLSMAYALFQLAKHQDYQDKLIDEVDKILAKFDGKLTYDAMKEMTYLEKVFSEILRMNPLTNSIQRSAKRDYKVPDSNIVIERGTTVIISPYAIQRDENLYPDPDTFDPDRFSPENTANQHPCAYIPFGVGPRSCLGRQLAKLQFFAGIVKIFTKFRIELSNKTKRIEDYDPMSTLLTTKGGVYLTIIPRKM